MQTFAKIGAIDEPRQAPHGWSPGDPYRQVQLSLTVVVDRETADAALDVAAPFLGGVVVTMRLAEDPKRWAAKKNRPRDHQRFPCHRENKEGCSQSGKGRHPAQRRVCVL